MNTGFFQIGDRSWRPNMRYQVVARFQIFDLFSIFFQ